MLPEDAETSRQIHYRCAQNPEKVMEHLVYTYFKPAREDVPTSQVGRTRSSGLLRNRGS